jgi:iron complex outermembrane receptor protein
MRFTSFTALNADGTANRSAGQILDDAEGIAVDNQIQVNVDTGPVAHTLLGGLDYSHSDTSYRYGANYDVPVFDLLDPNYGEEPIEGPTSDEFVSSTSTKQSLTGLYLQDQAEFERFVLTIGGRYDWLNTENESFLPPVGRTEQDDEKFSGRIGLNYLFDNGISPYVSYSTSFAPTIGSSFGGTPFDPTEGEQVEVGVKYTPSDLNLSVNAAVFQIKQTNVLSQDPDNAFFQIQLGEVESTGFEVQVTTSLADGLDLTAAYTYVDLEITAGDNIGNVPVGIPDHQFSVWGNYEVPASLAEGLGLGLGLRFQGESYADSLNAEKNDSRVFVDASLAYDFGKANPQLEGISAQVNAKNLFDERDVTCAQPYCYRDKGRDIIGSIKYRF